MGNEIGSGRTASRGDFGGGRHSRPASRDEFEAGRVSFGGSRWDSRDETSGAGARYVGRTVMAFGGTSAERRDEPHVPGLCGKRLAASLCLNYPPTPRIPDQSNYLG